MRKAAIVVALFLAALTAASSRADGHPVISIRPSADHRALNLTLRDAPVEGALRLLEIHLDRRIVLGEGVDGTVDYEATGVTPVEALRGIVRAAGLKLDRSPSFWTVRNPAERQVFLDVVDEDARSILERVAGQCGWRNVLIEPGLDGKGTFRLRGVPCSIAIHIVLESLGFSGRIEPNSVLVVER